MLPGLYDMSPAQMNADSLLALIPDTTYEAQTLIVWFQHGILNESYLGCLEPGQEFYEYPFEEGLPLSYDFIRNASLVSALEGLGVYRIDKLIPYLNPCEDTISISVRGDTVYVPDFSNILVMKYGTEYPLPMLCYSLITQFSDAVKYAEPNYLFKLMGAGVDSLRKAEISIPNDPEFGTTPSAKQRQWREFVDAGGWRNQDFCKLIALKVDDGSIAGAGASVATVAPAIIGGASKFGAADPYLPQYQKVAFACELLNMSMRADPNVIQPEEIRAALAYAYTNDVVLLAAAGNDGINYDPLIAYPAGADDRFVVCVSGSKYDGERHPGSDYGSSVDFATPFAVYAYAGTWGGGHGTYNTIYATNTANLYLTLKSYASVSVELHDIYGRRLGSIIPSTTLTAGTHYVGVPTVNLASGVYFARFVVDNMPATRKIVVFQ